MPTLEAEKSDRKSPGFWFYTADYERDMQILSMDAQGLWSRMLCWMSDNEAHRGFAELPTGAPMLSGDIASRIGKPERSVQRCLDEMERIGTFSRDHRGCVYCRRMARDTHISTVRKAAANSRMASCKRAADGTFAKPLLDGLAEQNVHQENHQTPSVTDPVSVSVSTEDTHPRVRVPLAADLNGQTSERFPELLARYPRTAHRDEARREWLSVVTVDREPAVFACLARYLASDEVSRGVVSGLPQWIRDCHRDGWATVWPAKVKPKRPESITEKTAREWEEKHGPTAITRQIKACHEILNDTDSTDELKATAQDYLKAHQD